MGAKTVDGINKKYLCMGCGTCVSICPSNAIDMEIKGGQYYPKLDKVKCVGCSKCVAVCPGISVSANSMADELWPSSKEDPRLGKFKSAFIGYSNDSKIRFEAASGGIATSLILGLMRRKIIDGAVLTRMSESDPLLPDSFVARTEEDVLAAQTSKYCPTSTAGLVRELKTTGEEGRFAFVGLPCQVHGVRKLQEQEEWAKKKIRLIIGIFCSHGLTFSGTRLILGKFARRYENIEKLQYRGKGWPGVFSVKYMNGEEFSISLDEYWPPFFGPCFFTPYRCLTCHDLTSELADISLGDAWIKEIRENDNVGTSIIIVRAPFAEEMLNCMRQSNEISLKEISYERVIESQRGILARKKIGIGARLKLLSFLSKPVPKYDQEFESSPRCLLGAILMFSNATVSRTYLGQRLLRRVPTRFLRRYSGYVYRYSGM